MSKSRFKIVLLLAGADDYGSHKQVQMQEEGWVSAQLFSSVFVTSLTMAAQIRRRRHVQSG